MNKELEQNPAPEEERGDVQQDAMEPAVSPGRELARRREELNLTVEQVAGQLNLAPRQVEAIEADNFDALPGMAIARGFVRSYARLVRLDAEPLLAAMAPAVAPMPEARPIKQTYVSKSLGGDRLSFSHGNSRKSKVVWIVLALVIVIAAIAAIQQNGRFSLPGTSEDEVPQTETEQSVQDMQQDGQAVEILPAPDVPSEPAPAAPAPQSSASPAASPVKSEASVRESGVSATNSSGLFFRAREQSWIELKRADGAVLVARLVEAGTEESFPVKGEMTLTVGNATGVDVVLRGEPVDLQDRARGNVARINVK